MQPRGRPITLTDDALLDIARDVFLERGLEATTSYIAKRARISESVIFYRYKTKEALFSAVFERQLVVPPEFAKLAWRAGTGEVADHLFDAGMSIVELSRRVLPFMMMAFVSPTKLNIVVKHASAPHPMRRQMLDLLSAYLEAEMQARRLRPGRAETLARTFFGAIAQFVMSTHIEPPSPELDAPTFVREMVDVLLRGAAETPGPRRRRTDTGRTARTARKRK
jgi:AcrR family transcriptional regulator